MKFRRGNLIAVGLVAALGLVGCSSGDPGASGDQTIVYWQHSFEARDNLVTEMASDFQAENEGLSVKTQFIPYDQYFDKLVTGLESGQGPDVFQVPEEMAEQLMGSGLIAPVPSSVLTSEQIESDYLSATVARWKSDEGYFALPTDVQSLVLFANSDLLTECGGDPSALPRTWDELYAQAKACTIRDDQGNIVQAGLDTAYKWAIYTQAMYSMTDKDITEPAECRTNLTDPEIVKAWETATAFSIGADAPNASNFMPGQSSFKAGTGVFYINHPVTMGSMKDFPDVNYVVGQAPTLDGETHSIVHSWAYVVSAKSANVDAAWKWVLQLSDEDAQRRWFTETGSLPAMQSVLDDPSLPTNDGERAALASLENARSVQTLPVKADDLTDATWDEIVIGGDDPKAALAKAKDQIDGLIRDTLDCS